MMVALIAYVGWHSRTRWGSHWQKYGPTYLTIASTILILADLIRHVLEDQDVWPARLSNGWGSDEYSEGCPHENMHCLSTVGWLFTVVATYSGFLLLVIGTMWNANICDKVKDIKAEWRRLRSLQ
eukprot:TRINITY_DN1139_c0_g1_i1.p1 TRINITY_DN1139_c0_g1~~TRINITY_DN1139_c0_g1_i1.p1  ORF type:complete len:125 (-),score=5.98 TRINITY_DN1139_c0_g1_i1:198-572(-)